MSESIINFEYSEDEKLDIIITNLIKMLISRQLIKPDKLDIYKKNITLKIKNKNEYIINLDNHDRQKNENYVIIIINEAITNTNRGSLIDSNLNKNADFHKIFIINEISPKYYKTIMSKYDNVEIFKKDELMINIIDHIYVPKHILLNTEEKKQFFEEYIANKTELPKIYISDPVAKYYNAKVGDIFRIIRPSEVTGECVYYRLVISGYAK